MLCVIGNLLDRSLAERAGTMLLPAVLGKFNNAEQLVANTRHLAAEQTSELIPATQLPLPAIHKPGLLTAVKNRRTADDRSEPGRRIKKPVEGEHDQKCD